MKGMEEEHLRSSHIHFYVCPFPLGVIFKNTVKEHVFVTNLFDL